MRFNNSQKVLYNLKQERKQLYDIQKGLLDAIDWDNKCLKELRLSCEERFLLQFQLSLIENTLDVLDRRYDLLLEKMQKEDEKSAEEYRNYIRAEVEKQVREEHEKQSANNQQI